MSEIRQIVLTAVTNFRGWRKNPKVILSFCIYYMFSVVR